MEIIYSFELSIKTYPKLVQSCFFFDLIVACLVNCPFGEYKYILKSQSTEHGNNLKTDNHNDNEKCVLINPFLIFKNRALKQTITNLLETD